MALTVVLRSRNITDLADLAAIENECFPDPSWKANDFLLHDCSVAEVEGKVVGFVVSREVFKGSDGILPEREILNLAVTPRFRRTGLATRLLKLELERGADLFLEVRESNLAAFNCYKKLGFEEISRRSAYYQNPQESAIVMRLK